MTAQPKRLSGLVMDMHQGDALTLGAGIRVHFLRKSGRVTRVIVSAPPDMKVTRETDRLSASERRLARPLLEPLV